MNSGNPGSAGIDRAGHWLAVAGRALLGLYFILPGIMKITGYAGTSEYMAAHGVPMIAVLLPLTIVLQIGGGLSLVSGFWARPSAFVLAGLTLVISVFMHDFWQYEEGMERAHEMQNFIKNLAIMAGLMVVAGRPARAP
ncbi:MAG TPA: DoxX family protein [Pseudomonadales bacterium]|nr:DoxX family protein [Pseudomonadales bacterium]